MGLRNYLFLGLSDIRWVGRTSCWGLGYVQVSVLF